MNIKVAIIDHETAGVEDRERFSFTPSLVEQGVRECIEEQGVTGCIILSTCNRTEMYISSREDGECPSPFDLMCKLKGLDREKYRSKAVELTGNRAIKHLFELSCGMKSRIFGEDQIVTQVKDATSISREQGALSTKLELLFKSAVTCAKKVKTHVKLSSAEKSLGETSLKVINNEFASTENIHVMVIGNGEMGRLVARTLAEQGIKVYMTIRRYKSKDVLIPSGCGIVEYENRFEVMGDMDVVISATRSPHYTVTYNDIEPIINKKMVFIDLAMPRDIDSEIDKLDKAELYNIDSFKTSGNEEAIAKADFIINQSMEQLMTTYRFRKYLPMVKEITGNTAEYVSNRVQTKTNDEKLVLYIEEVTTKAVARLIYGMRDNIEHDKWELIMSAMEKGAKK